LTILLCFSTLSVEKFILCIVMKHVLHRILWILWVSLGLTSFCVAANLNLKDIYSDDGTILTQDVDDVLSDEVSDVEWGWFAAGIDALVWCADGTGINGIICDPIEDTGAARDTIAQLIQTIINYILALTGLVALIYLIYHGFLVLTAGDNEDRSKAGRKGVKYAFIAIAGIALSWFIIWFIFYIISLVSDAG